MTKRSRLPLTFAFFFGGLLVLTYFWISIVSGPLGFFARSVPNLSTVQNVAQIAAILAAACLFVSAAIIAIPTALQPGGRFRKLLDVLPAYVLLFTLAGIVARLLQIGTTGSVIGGPGPEGISFATAWLALGVILSTVVTAIAAARANLGARTLKAAAGAMVATTLVSIVAVAATVGTAIILSNAPISAPSARPPEGGNPPAGQTQNQTAPGTAPATREAGAPPANAEGGRREGGGGEGGGEGGFANRQANMVRQMTTGSGLMALSGVIELVSLIGALRGLGGMSTAGTAARLSYPREVGRALVAGVIVTVVGFIAIQFVPVAHTNPPVQTTVQWDSQQTQQLWTRACADCHSNQTVWPWYTTFAPGSWLLASHVNNARQQFNISELTAFRRSGVANEAAQQIRSGAMPPSDYLILHPDARLSDAEKQQLIQGLRNSIK